MNNGSEVVESLRGLHGALGHVIEVLEETVVMQENEISRLRGDLQVMHSDLDYWKYQLEIHGIDPGGLKPGVRPDAQVKAPPVPLSAAG
jgi:hypothetical protein